MKRGGFGRRVFFQLVVRAGKEVVRERKGYPLPL
jgi:hypothetical protein